MIAIAASLLLLLLFAAVLASGSTWSDVLSPARNELVFAGRNRDYGAYTIRREHHRVMAIAFGVAMALVGSILLLPRLLVPAPPDIPLSLPSPDDRVLTFIPPDQVVRTVPPAPPKPPANPERMSVPVAVDSIPITEVDTIAHVPDPAPDPGPIGIEPDPGIPTDLGPGTGGSGGVRDTTVREGWEADIAPEYPGGLDALYNDLRNIIRYPQADAERGREGKVFVTFVVTEDGSIAHVELGRGISTTMDAEALRAVRQLKKRWKPGQFRGESVRVRYSLPISFRLAK